MAGSDWETLFTSDGVPYYCNKCVKRSAVAKDLAVWLWFDLLCDIPTRDHAIRAMRARVYAMRDVWLMFCVRWV